MNTEQPVKEFKQWWVTAKHTLKCDEYDAMEIWLAARSDVNILPQKLSVNWFCVDKEIKYIAMDEDGGWRGYTEKPHKHPDKFWTTGDVDDYYDLWYSEILNIPKGFNWNTLDWEDTLFIRED